MELTPLQKYPPEIQNRAGFSGYKMTEEAINGSYELAGLERPEKIVWCGSPLSMILTKTISTFDHSHCMGGFVGSDIVKSIASIPDNVIWDSVRRATAMPVWSSVWDFVGGFIWDSVLDSIRNSDEIFMCDSILDSVEDSVLISTGNHIEIEGLMPGFMKSSSWTAVQESLCGWHRMNSAWLSECFRENSNLMDKLKSMTWWLPYEKICWVSKKHLVLVLDARARPHCLSGPAIEHPDGWSIYAVHGTRVEADEIKDHKLIIE